jgi:hypothetical protein
MSLIGERNAEPDCTTGTFPRPVVATGPFREQQLKATNTMNTDYLIIIALVSFAGLWAITGHFLQALAYALTGWTVLGLWVFMAIFAATRF